jgi:hypothetical protein
MEGPQSTGRRRNAAAAATTIAATAAVNTPPASPSTRTPKKPPKKTTKAEKRAKTEDPAPPAKEEKKESKPRVKKRSLDDTDMADDESAAPPVQPKRAATRVKVEPREGMESVLPSIEVPMAVSQGVQTMLPEPAMGPVPAEATVGEGGVRIKFQPVSQSPPPVMMPGVGAEQQEQQQQQQPQNMILLPTREGFGPFGGVYPPPQHAVAADPPVDPRLLEMTMRPKEVEVKVEPRWE